MQVSRYAAFGGDADGGRCQRSASGDGQRSLIASSSARRISSSARKPVVEFGAGLIASLRFDLDQMIFRVFTSISSPVCLPLTFAIMLSTGYPLDSAGPNSLWLAVHLDHRLISSRRSVDGLLHEPEKQFPAALRCPAVEAECELVKVVWQLPGSHSALMGSEQPSLRQQIT